MAQRTTDCFLKKKKKRSENSNWSDWMFQSFASDCVGATWFGTQAHVKFTRTQSLLSYSVPQPSPHFDVIKVKQNAD